MITPRAKYKQISHFEELLVTQLQQDTKENVMYIFLLLPSCGWSVNHFLSYFYSSFSIFFNFSGCNFEIPFSFSCVASLGIMVILPLIINNFSIIGYTVGSFSFLFLFFFFFLFQFFWIIFFLIFILLFLSFSVNHFLSYFYSSFSFFFNFSGCNLNSHVIFVGLLL